MPKPWELTVNVLVFSRDHGRVLVVPRTKPPLVGWRLPPGGHVEPGERPDEAARREVREETGLEVELADTRPDLPLSLDDEVRRVVQPHHIQIEPIDDRHDHLDLIYIAYPVSGADDSPTGGAEWVKVEHTRGDERVPANVKLAIRSWLESTSARDGRGAGAGHDP